MNDAMPSNSFVFCTSHINLDPANTSFYRYKAWIDHYLPLLGELNADKLFLIDDGGSDCSEYINMIEGDLPQTLLPVVNVYRFDNNLGRSSLTQFPGWWRSFFFSIDIARKYGYRKIVHIESDFFVLSRRLVKFIRDLNDGWTGVYSTYYNFPETCLQIIGEDCFDKFAEIRSAVEANLYKTDTYAELIIPFTRISRAFMGDRFGEPPVLADWIMHRASNLARLDYIAQVNMEKVS
jgi:hypothetical protein